MRLYTKSQAKRHKIGDLVKQGATIAAAENIELKNDSNRSRNIAKWKELGLYPYGEIDPPGPTQLSSSLRLNKVDNVAPETVFNVHDSVDVDPIQTLIEKRIDQLWAQDISLIIERIDNLEAKLSAVQQALRD